MSGDAESHTQSIVRRVKALSDAMCELHPSDTLRHERYRDDLLCAADELRQTLLDAGAVQRDWGHATRRAGDVTADGLLLVDPVAYEREMADVARVRAHHRRLRGILLSLRSEAKAARNPAASGPTAAEVIDGGLRQEESVLGCLEDPFEERLRGRETDACATQTDFLLQDPARETLQTLLDSVTARPLPSEVRAQYRSRTKHRMETIYKEAFYNNGMTMIWLAMATVYRLEFDPLGVLFPTCVPSALSTPRDGGSGSGGSAGGGGGGGGSGRVDRRGSATTAAKAAGSFLSCLEERVLPRLASPEAFNSALAATVPSLSDSFLCECESLGCKPNSMVLRTLQDADRKGGLLSNDSVSTLDLSQNLMSGAGLRALLSILHRLPSLTHLSLAGNTLQNDAVAGVCAAVADHPALTSLDLSGNRISRAAGKEVLRLLAQNARIVEVGLEHTRIEPTLRNRIASLLSAQRARAPPQTAPPQPGGEACDDVLGGSESDGGNSQVEAEGHSLVS